MRSTGAIQPPHLGANPLLVRRSGIFPTSILLATGGSRKARRVVEAIELANGTSSELHVVYVVPMVPELPYPRSSTKERSEALLEPRRLGGLRLLDEQVRRIKKLGQSVAALHYREDRPEKEGIRLGEELDAGLIVMGGQRRLWLERIFGPASRSASSGGRDIQSSW